MTSFGYTLSSEEHPPAELVRNARRAEEGGFDFASISDHFHPWIGAQGHSPFVWSVLGAIANATESMQVGVGVTCPTTRIHPAVLAQATATTSLLFGDRFFFGVGTGEALNEHILGDRWPVADLRRSMLEEAVEVIRAMWTGKTVNHRGEHYEVVNARLFDPPDVAPRVIVSGFGKESTRLAGRIGDGYWGHAPAKDQIDLFKGSGGTGPRYAQIDLCWAEDTKAAKQTVLDVWPNGAVPGQLTQDLPTWNHFEQAAELVTVKAATDQVPCGPDVEPLVEAVQRYVDAGYSHVYFHQIGADQEGFFNFWSTDLQPALADLAVDRSAA